VRAPEEDPVPGAVAGLEATVRGAVGLVAAGHPVVLDPAPGADAAGELAALVAAAVAAGLGAQCRLTVPLGPLGDAAAAALVGRVLEAGLGADVAGPLDGVRALVARVPAAGAVVPAAAPGAEEACRELAGGRVRLGGRRRSWAGRRAADLAFVRCLNVLMAADGHVGVGTSDPRLVAVAGERAAWNERDPESWEYVMRQGVRVAEQRRLVAGGYTVRVVVASGAGR
jgi:proline dehydrogenase